MNEREFLKELIATAAEMLEESEEPKEPIGWKKETHFIRIADDKLPKPVLRVFDDYPAHITAYSLNGRTLMYVISHRVFGIEASGVTTKKAAANFLSKLKQKMEE